MNFWPFRQETTEEKAERNLRRYWYLLILLGIVVMAFWFRSFPARYGELQAIDPFYLFRMSEYSLNHGFQLPELDTLRNHPIGEEPWKEPLFMFHFPALIYLLGLGWNMTYFHFAIIFPAVMGALAVLIMFFLAREFFDWKAGLISSFILAALPAFITRTSAGFFEKEPIAGVFSLLAFWMFIRAYKKSDWRYGVVSGISIFLLTQTWGGSTYFVMLLGGLVVLLLILNRYSEALLKASVPTLLLGIGLTQFLPYNKYTLTSSSALIAFAALALLAIRFGAEKYNLLEKDKLPWLVPGLLVAGFLSVLIGSMFSDFFYSLLDKFYGYSTLRLGVVGSTVAESQIGSWNAILSVTSASVGGFLGPIAPYFSVWIFAFLGMFMVIYRFISKAVIPAFSEEESGHFNWLLLFPLIWFVSSIWGALGFIRLSFIIGPPFALLAGVFLAWAINRALKIDLKRFREKVEEADIWDLLKQYKHWRLTYVVILLLALFVIINFTTAYAYSNSLRPSICFPNQDILIDGQKCLEYDGQTYTYAQGQPWYQAMRFLREDTPEGSAVLSWWDFGYWFETRGHRPTPTDGGLGNRYETAVWFTSENWEDNTWPEDRDISYILMDYTLPGKYGAISKISSDGDQVVGIMQFKSSGKSFQGNKTIYEFKAGPYEIWLPMDNTGNIASAPIFLVTQNGQYIQRAHVKDICSSSGIIQMSADNTIGGCVALTSTGVYYVPEEAEHTIFSKLMFMDGYGLPVEKVFDNQLIKIYEINSTVEY